ncbi:MULTISPECIES: hypothetical protein [unclassified Crossiella]|uniref:hypothetical protein n=1 Tax=unclassified Crossiella TaxID=2620835 RepID=UPI001FFEAABF|nr:MULTISPECIES: hypothetical protein [unclassified Crossiella]MCK2243323.1 hypothetical protein [Crossiella sp. S99.2]MCK2254208.1 hypothetical protein [Crossiella sp. S99.1]
MDPWFLQILLVGIIPVFGPPAWMFVHTMRAEAFRRFHLRWLAKKHGWKYKVTQFVSAERETVRFSGVYRGQRFRCREVRNTDGGSGESFKVSMEFPGFGHLPDCEIRYHRIRCRVEVWRGDARILTETDLRWWMLRRPVTSCHVEVTDGVLRAKWGYQFHGGVFRRKFAFLLGVAKRLEQVAGTSSPGSGT